MKTGFVIILFLPCLLHGFNTCCKEGEVLDILDLHVGSYPRCVTSEISTVSKNNLLGGQTSSGVKYPVCTEFEYFEVTQYNNITSNGTLQLRKYREAIPEDRYCIDATTDGKEVAVTCNQCKEGKPCINTCCPFGMTFNQPDINYDYNNTEIDYDLEESTCIEDTSGILLEFFSPNDESLQWKEGSHYILVGPTNKDGLASAEFLFNCPIKENPWYQPDQDGLKLDSSGRLHGNSEVDDKDYRLGTYCVFNTSQKVGYATCQLDPQTPENNYCEDVRKHTFNVGFVLSIIFIIFSIIAHIVETELKIETMFGKMSVVYLVNMLGQFLVILIDRFLDPLKGTIPCVLIAYSKQYFNLSFFFSINVLAIICYNRVNEMGVTKFKLLKYMGKVLNTENKSFLWKGLVYVQGVPLLITFVTWIIDQKRIQWQQISNFDTTSYPEAGVVYCYLSYQNPDPNNRPSYFITPEFIYVQSVQILLLLSNIVLFGKTAHVFFKNKRTADNKKALDEFKENSVIMAKLFFVMVCFWIFEIVTSAIVSAYGINDTCKLRFALDVPNAFFGLLVFLVMVCSKPPVVQALMGRGRRFLSGITGSSYVPPESSRADTATSKLPPTKSLE